MDDIKKESDNLVYEVGYHLLPTIDESEAPVQAVKIKSLLEEKGGAVISEEMPKMMPLAYDIAKNINSKTQKFSKAYFGWIKFEAEPAKIAEIKTKLDNMAEILRFILVKTVRENTIHVPKIPMFKKESVKEDKSAENPDKPKASEEEIDKSIDNLIIG